MLEGTAVRAERSPAGEHRLPAHSPANENWARTLARQGDEGPGRGSRVGAGAALAPGSANTTPIGDLRNFVMQGVAQLTDTASQRRGLLRQRPG
ncbi:hypothetical protein MJ579_03605 [Klebsiella pneumoniae]|nr:hypothetical protein MJ579_03605 [Klebsiella pneumoniae]